MLDNVNSVKPIYKFPSHKMQNGNRKLDTDSEEFMGKVGLWTSFYRLFPFVFVTHFLGIELKLFQAFLIYCMMHMDDIVYIATRG